MNELITQFHFLRPWWLLALVPVVLVWLGLRRNRLVSNPKWRQVIAPHLLPFLLEGEASSRSRWPLWGLLGLWVLATIAVAGPAWKTIPQPVEQSANHLVIAWDMSPSMLAEDVKPSRLQRSRLKLIDLLSARKEGQAALVAYAGEAHTVTPLTDDVQTIINLLPALSPTTLPTTGSNPEMALEQAQQLLKDAGALTGDILFVTDGITEEAFDELQRLAEDSPYRVSIWGVGTTDGAPIPLPGGGFARDVTGKMVLPQLNETELNELAADLNGYYVPMVNSDNDVETLVQLLNDSTPSTEISTRVFDRWFEHGQWLAVLILPFVALLFRRGWIFCALFFLPFSMQSTTAEAAAWSDLWRTQDQQAQARLEQGDKDAAGLFSTPARRGAALYQHEEYAEAAQEFGKGTRPVDHYNRGTALTQAGEYKAAIEAFDRALAEAPDFEIAKENKAIAQQLAELAQQQQQQQQEGSDKSEGEQGQDGESGQQGESDPRAGEGENGQQGSKPENESQQSKEQSGDGASDDSASDGQDDSGQNPFSEVEPETGDAQTEAPAAGDKETEQPATEVAATDQTGQSEEEQMLEQMLRKVPDDPGGLLRNKFKYEHLKRRQSLPDTSPYSNQAEQRW